MDQTDTVATIHFVAVLACMVEFGLIVALPLEPILGVAVAVGSCILTLHGARTLWRSVSQKSVRAFQSMCCGLTLGD